MVGLRLKFHSLFRSVGKTSGETRPGKTGEKGKNENVEKHNRPPGSRITSNLAITRYAVMGACIHSCNLSGWRET